MSPHRNKTFRQIRVLSISAAAGWLAVQPACSLAPVADRQASRVSTVAISAASEPALQVLPANALRRAPESVYRNPKIGVVYLRAHQDAGGRLLGPQIMYQVVDPGGWNVDAVEQGDGYIPAVNLEGPAHPGSRCIVPAIEAPAPSAPTPLLDPDRVAHTTLTGLMKPEDKPQAEAMAGQMGAACVAVFDAQAGWLLMPSPKP